MIFNDLGDTPTSRRSKGLSFNEPAWLYWTLLGPLRHFAPSEEIFLLEPAGSLSTCLRLRLLPYYNICLCMERDKEINHLTIINFRRLVLARGGCRFPQGFLAFWPRILQDS